MWDEAQFEAFLRNNPPTQAQQVRLSEVAARLNLTPMEHPWAYLKELQASFDYGKIKYTEDYYDVDMNPAAEPTAYRNGKSTLREISGAFGKRPCWDRNQIE